MFDPRDNDDAYQPPPTEAEWEVFMKRSDARSAKYAELLETLLTHPDRDAIIQREMGWDSDPEADDALESLIGGALDAATGWEDASLHDLAQGESDSPDTEFNSIDDDDELCDFRESPLYQKTFDWGRRLTSALHELVEAADELEPDDPLQIAFSECLVVAAKIAGSHAMSDDEESLGGSIVYTKRALKSATETLAALSELAEQQVMSPAELQQWLAETREVCSAIRQRIEELRSRVWWE